MLHVPAGANTFAAIQSNNSGRPTAPQGTSVTPGTGSKGSWAQLIATLDHDTYGLLICINNNNTSAASRNTVLDIGIGAASSEVVLIPDLICGNAVNFNVNGGGVWYYFPVLIPAGTRIAARAEGSVATAFNVYVQAMQRPLQPSMVRAAGFVEAIGASGDSGVTVTPGTTGEGAWTLLGTTVKECWHWQIGSQVTTADTTHNANAIHLDLAEGDGTNFDILMDSVLMNTNTTEGTTRIPFALNCEKRVPAGRNIYARAQCSGSVDTLEIVAYGAGG